MSPARQPSNLDSMVWQQQPSPLQQQRGSKPSTLPMLVGGTVKQVTAYLTRHIPHEREEAWLEYVSAAQAAAPPPPSPLPRGQSPPHPPSPVALQHPLPASINMPDDLYVDRMQSASHRTASRSQPQQAASQPPSPRRYLPVWPVMSMPCVSIAMRTGWHIPMMAAAQVSQRLCYSQMCSRHLNCSRHQHDRPPHLQVTQQHPLHHQQDSCMTTSYLRHSRTRSLHHHQLSSLANSLRQASLGSEAKLPWLGSCCGTTVTRKCCGD
jgi:hypothetical protein